jgi:hypothetical protein
MSWVNLDTSRLGVVPVLRRFRYVPTDDPLFRREPRLFDAMYLHFGFEEWNGVRFVWKARVDRAIWPCLHNTANACDDRQADPYEPFVTPLP